MLLDSGAGNRPSRKSSRDRICSSPMPTKYSKLVTAQEISNTLMIIANLDLKFKQKFFS